MVRSALTPWPVRLTTWGLPGALSVMVTVPVRVPVAVGRKATLTSQLLLGYTVPQAPLGRLKSPVATMLETVTATVPVLFNAKDCCWELVVFKTWSGKDSPVGDTKKP